MSTATLKQLTSICKKINKYFYQNDLFNHPDIQTFAYPQTIEYTNTGLVEVIIALNFSNLKIGKDYLNFSQFRKYVLFMEQLLDTKNFSEYRKYHIKFLCYFPFIKNEKLYEKGMFILSNVYSKEIVYDLLWQVDNHLLLKE